LQKVFLKEQSTIYPDPVVSVITKLYQYSKARSIFVNAGLPTLLQQRGQKTITKFASV